ncbi:YndM family protein [Oceanobacillus luteolus]|uniref:YndM family protein n=1 Tax=Oceanobacillus luteolus TaxID=1274358 RepID=A0ABW4HNB1_9BACI|nr:YndM family protein [Oceanobacillus luteolus]MCM3739484.1 YndM family protein [Oceanobacillus luteolus]
MNKHLRAFLIKFVGAVAILYLILGFSFGMTFTQVLVLSIILGALAYLLGDLFILPKTNNTIGTIADFGLAWAVIYLYIENMTAIDNTFTASLLAAIGVTFFEIFFHRYVEANVFPDQEEQKYKRGFNYQTEIAEDFDTNQIHNKNKRNQ